MTLPTHTILDQVSKTTIQLLLKEPFYGHFFTGLLREVTTTLPTMAVGATPNKMIKLYVNPNFWTDVLTTPEYRYGVLKHEILHIVLKHITQSIKFSNKPIYNIAADIVVNQYIDIAQLPEGAILLKDYKRLNLEPNQDVGYYYQKLLAEWQNIVQKVQNCEALTDKERRFSDLVTFPTWHLDMHELWSKEFEKMTESERKIVEGLIAGVLTNAVKRVGPKGIGNLPAGLQEYIETFLASLEPIVDWRRTLRLFAGSSMRTYLKNTIRRPSRRYGTTPGIKIKNRQKLLVAIDTSGSVNNDDLKEFFGELYHIWRQNAEILVVECDTHIHHKYFYKGITPNVIHGRGGTDFTAPIEYANKEYLPDAIIYFTDGYGNTSVKSRKPIMWLISSSGVKEDDPFWQQLEGRKVKMTKSVNQLNKI